MINANCEGVEGRVMAQFVVPLQYLSGGTEEYHEEPQSRQATSGPR
jgi:hypothetical protein